MRQNSAKYLAAYLYTEGRGSSLRECHVRVAVILDKIVEHYPQLSAESVWQVSPFRYTMMTTMMFRILWKGQMVLFSKTLTGEDEIRVARHCWNLCLPCFREKSFLFSFLSKIYTQTCLTFMRTFCLVCFWGSILQRKKEPSLCCSLSIRQ